MHFLIFLQELTTALHESVEEGECPFYINHFMSESSQHVGGGGGSSSWSLAFHAASLPAELSCQFVWQAVLLFIRKCRYPIYIYKISYIHVLYQISNKIY